MRGYFDEDEPRAQRPRRDTEMTLGAGALLGLGLALVLICGLCFGVGYALGHRRPVSSSASTVPTAAPDQEPLQPDNSIPKPSASETSPAPALPPGDAAGTPANGDAANPPTTQPGPGASGQSGAGQGTEGPPAAAGINSQQVQPALPGAGNSAPGPQSGAAPNVQSAFPSQTQWMVQVAAVANANDADVLVTALRRHGYSVTATRDPADGLIHVRIGPFSSHDEALRWHDKLFGDGYNAEIQP
jgi:cell division septation protein DedD